MPFETPLAAEGNPDSLRNVESFHAADRVTPDVQAQLSHPGDIASANQFFKPTGGQQFLPPGEVGAHHIELGAMSPSGQFAAPPMTGLETHGLMPAGGGDISGLAGAAMPGAEPISPLINMIMKMPGHIGLASSFFEALGAFFAPAMEMVGNVAGNLDIGSLFEHAGAASEAVGHALEHGMSAAGDHLGADLSLLPNEAPIFEQIGHGVGEGVNGQLSAQGLESNGIDFRGNELNLNPDQHLRDSFAQSPKLEVGGGPKQEMFEMSPRGGGFEGGKTNYLAMEPNHGFGGTVGNFSPPTPTAAPTVVHQTPPLSQSDFSNQHNFSNNQQGDFGRDVSADNGTARHHLMDAQTGATAGDASTAHATDTAVGAGDKISDKVSEVSDSQPQSTSYTVHSGDNLWDIAREHLGDGSRWEEIYHLNQNVLGDNPRLIMPGTELQIPGGEQIAGAGGAPDYTVHAGDNLWDISKDHLGGGQNWHDLYQNNQGVIGSNPDMIHPGQQLHMDGAGASHDASMQGDAHAAAAHAPQHHNLAHSGHSSTHNLAHNNVHNVGHSAPHNIAHGTAHDTSHATQSIAHHGTTPTAEVSHAAPPAAHTAGGELKAQARSLSSIQSYGDASHTIDSAAQVPNQL